MVDLRLQIWKGWLGNPPFEEKSLWILCDFPVSVISLFIDIVIDISSSFCCQTDVQSIK